MRCTVALTAALLLVPALAHAAGPETLADKFVAAWNAHDPKAFEALYTPDAVWVPVAEERTEGRAAIVSEFAKVHVGGWAAKTTIVLKDKPEAHLVRPDVATIFFHMDFLMNGQPVPGLQRALILVASADKSGDWKISAGQLTKESPAK
jgi:uncharacterized protein (TIGR02246 family)